MIGKNAHQAGTWNEMEMLSAFFNPAPFSEHPNSTHKHNGTNKSKVLNTNGPSISYVGHLDSVTFLFSSFKAAFAQRNFHPLFPVKVTKSIVRPQFWRAALQPQFPLSFRSPAETPSNASINGVTSNGPAKMMKIRLSGITISKKGISLQGLIFFQVLGSMFFIGVRWSKYICKNNSNPSLTRSLCQSFCVLGSPQKLIFSKKGSPFHGFNLGFHIKFQDMLENKHSPIAEPCPAFAYPWLSSDRSRSSSVDDPANFENDRRQQVLLARAATNRTKRDPKKKHHYS